jgi:hypothetical protein
MKSFHNKKPGAGKPVIMDKPVSPSFGRMNRTSAKFSFNVLVDLCHRTHREMQSRAVRSVDIALVARNWSIGWYIVEYEQKGADKAKYGSRLIDRLAAKLKISGASATNHHKFRQFYQEYPIQQTLAVESGRALLAPARKRAIS